MKVQKLLTMIAAAAMIPAGAAFAQNGPQNVSGGAMESWSTYTVGSVSLYHPDGWIGSDSLIAGLANNPIISVIVTLEPHAQVVESDDAHGGTHAAQLFSRFAGDTAGIVPGSLINGHMSLSIGDLMGGGGILDNIHYSGGESVSDKVDHVDAWLKVGDSGAVNNVTVSVIVQNDSSIIGQGFKSVDPTSISSYTKITVPITYNSTNYSNSKLLVIFSSEDASDSTKTPNEYNSVKVDDVTYTEGTTGITIPLMTENAMLVYPNPASNTVHFNLKSTENPENFNLRITDVTGRVLKNLQLTNRLNAEDFSQWANGIYFYQLTNTKTDKQQRGKFILK